MFLFSKSQFMSLALKAEDGDYDRQINFEEIEAMGHADTVDVIPMSFNSSRRGQAASTTIILECAFGGLVRLLEVSKWEYHKLVAGLGAVTTGGLISGISAPKGRLFLAVNNR